MEVASGYIVKSPTKGWFKVLLTWQYGTARFEYMPRHGYASANTAVAALSRWAKKFNLYYKRIQRINANGTPT